MEMIISITALIIAIMAFSSVRISFVIRIIFSCITSYYLLTLGDNSIIIWNDKDYTLENLGIFLHSGMAFKCIFYFCLSFVSFSFILFFLLKKILDITIKHKFDKAFNKLNEFEKRKFLRILNACLPKIFKKTASNIYELSEKETNQYYNDILNAFTFYVHFVISWLILSINNHIYMLVIFISVFIALLIFLLIAPIMRFLSEAVNKIRTHNI